MPRLHSTLIALVLGGAAAAGLFALVKTVQLGQTAAAAPRVTVSAHELSARRAKLARWSHALERARAKRPPALPKLPKFAPIPTPPPAPAAPVSAAPAAASVTYTRPATVVEYRHAAKPAASAQSQGDDQYEQEGESGGDGGGEGD